MTSDDAGGGRRGLRATPSLTLLDAVRAAYGIETDSEPIDLGGSSNLNLLLVDGNSQYVVRVYRPHVGDERLGAVQAVRRQLSRGGVPCDALIATRSGDPWLAVGDRLVEVEDFVEHDADMDSWERLEIGLPVLGHMHSLMQKFDAPQAARNPRFANYLDGSHVVGSTSRGVHRIRSWQPSAIELQMADNAEELAKLVAEAWSDADNHLPHQLVHGDFWDNNVFFRGDKIVFVTDFDYMGHRARIDDLALTIYFACLEYPERPVSRDQLQRVRRLIDAYDSGCDAPLNSTERAALPVAIARQPLWSIGGWVALLDDEQSARTHARATASDVHWALNLMAEVDRWKEAFAG